MENITETGDIARKIERSKAYPGIHLEEAINFTQNVAKSFTASQVINRDDIAAVLGKKASTIDRDIAAAVQYGFFIKAKDEKSERSGYRLTGVLKQITYPLNPIEKTNQLLECFKTPKLFKELIDKYDEHALPELKPILIRFHGSTERAADDAEQVFRASAQFVGALNDKGILNLATASKGPTVQYAEIITEDQPKDEQRQNSNQILQLPTPAQTPRNDVANEDGEKVKIRLSNKKYAWLIYPDDINSTDIEILKKEIEKLELIIGQ